MHRRKILVCFLLSVFAQTGMAQTIAAKLTTAVQQMEADPQLRHAIVSVCVADAQTGKNLYAHNAQLGVAPASSQKIFTSVAAFDLLGKDYRYKTLVGYDGKIENGVLDGNLHIKGFGDPTLGSWRYNDTREEVVLQKIVSAIQTAGIKKINKYMVLNSEVFGLQPIPGGWIWDDIGNYYGAGCWGLNWHENQYDLLLQPGSKEGDTAHIRDTNPELLALMMINQITTGKKGSGDNGFIYLPPYSYMGFTQGTIPPGSSPFTISGAFSNGPLQLGHALELALHKKSISTEGFKTPFLDPSARVPVMQETAIKMPDMQQTIITLYSPPLDSIVYWFLKKSINLYGEALIRTMAFEKSGQGTTEKGVELLRNFWAERGIDKGALNILDGSGLSPQNRVTTDAQVKALQYARTRPWYNSFYYAMPEYNGMKMKSGSIGGARAFAGYHKQYVFSIIVNNYDGSPGEVVKKMYKVLDVLK
jgi:D-alanyl-D-alanine carboxypeptidase/D-alanyl-D-alanine-endopeptidase (penicillin-binding protein 4)